ncbi:MAG: NAD(P)-dependent oxidoreductase, partial [Actinomycetes bacterium]
TMVTDGTALLQTLDGPTGVLCGAAKHTVVIDCSTIGAEAAADAAERCASAGLRFVDCPVSGSTQVARAGKLGLMAGGDAEVIDEVRPVLEALGTVVPVGPTGAGAAAKVAVNALLHAFNTALAECVVTARTAGVDPDAFFDVLAAGVLWNRFLDYKRPAYTDPEHTPVAFDLGTATKDLGLAVQAEERAGITASVVARALELHRRAVADGLGDRDMAALAAWFAGPPHAGGGTDASEARPPRDEPERN